MASDKNEKDVSTNNPKINYASNTLRKSILIQDVSLPVLLENDDEQERLLRRCEISATTKSVATTTVNDRRRSLGLTFLGQMSATEMYNCMTECIKLGVENKINTKNAFNLQTIDFMSYLIKKQDENMSNLQVATVALDMSTKVYGYRVDSIYTEMIKLTSGLEKQDEKHVMNDNEADNSTVQDDLTKDKEKRENKKKKRCKQKGFNTVESLKGTLEVLKPTLWMMGNDDSQTASNLYQAMLPNHVNSKYYLHSYADVIVDTVESKKNLKDGGVSIPGLDFTESHICPPMADFEFFGWVDDDKTENYDAEEEKEAATEYQFDLDASVPADEDIVRSIDPFNIDEEDENEENMVRYIQKPIENLVDLRNVITGTGLATSSEYSMLEKNRNAHWAGPAHWKINNVGGAVGGSKIVEACPQERGRKRKEIEIHYDVDLKKAVLAKFTLSSRIQIRQTVAERDWYESLVTLPQDLHYDIATMNKLNLHALISIDLQNKDDLNTTHVSDDIGNYNYDNENDTSNYCPNVPVTDYEADDNVGNDDCENEIPENFGNNLVAIPTLTNAVSIAYSVRAKRVDMRQLKKSIWKRLVEPDNTETIDIQQEVQQDFDNKMKVEKMFSKIYKKLPELLTKTNAESLSFPISFVSLLHLANEKTLRLESLQDMSDIVVAAN